MKGAASGSTPAGVGAPDFLCLPICILLCCAARSADALGGGVRVAAFAVATAATITGSIDEEDEDEAEEDEDEEEEEEDVPSSLPLL